MTDDDLIVLAKSAAERKDSPMKPDEAILMLELCRRLDALTVPISNIDGGLHRRTVMASGFGPAPMKPWEPIVKVVGL